MTFLGYLAKMGTPPQRKVVFGALPRAFGVGLKVGMTLHHLALFLTTYTMLGRGEGGGKGHGRLFRDTFHGIFRETFTEYFLLKWQNDRRQIGGLMSWCIRDILRTTHYKVDPALAPLVRATIFGDEDVAGLTEEQRASLDRARLLKDPAVPPAAKVDAIRAAPRRSLAFEMISPEAYDKNSPAAADIMAAMVDGGHVPGLRMVRMLRRFVDAGLFERHPHTVDLVRRAVRDAAAVVTPMHYLYATMALVDPQSLAMLKPEYETALAMLDAGFFHCFDAPDRGSGWWPFGGAEDNGGFVCGALAPLRDAIFFLDISGSMQAVYNTSPLRAMDICFLIGYVAHRAGGECWAYDARTYPCDFGSDHQSVLSILRRARRTGGGITVPQQAIEAVAADIEGRRTAKMFVFLTDNDVNSHRGDGAPVDTIMDAARRQLLPTCGPIATCVLHTCKLPGDRTMFDPGNHLNGVVASDAATSADVLDTLALRTKTRNFTEC